MLYPLSHEGWEPRRYQGAGAAIGAGRVGWLGDPMLPMQRAVELRELQAATTSQ